jgi:transcriptional regulator with XRE-family HTH domain
MTPIHSSTDSKLSIGKRVADIAAAEGLTQQALAQRIGISPGFLSSVIRDLKLPGSEFLFSLKQAFGVSIDWLLTGEGTMYSRNGIDVELLQNILLQYQLWYAAQVEASPAALALLQGINEATSSRERTGSEDQEQFLAQCQAVSNLLRGAAFLYNSRSYAKDQQARLTEIQSAVRNYIASHHVPDIAAALGLGGEKAGNTVNRVDIAIEGNAHNFAGVNFNAQLQPSKKKGPKL